MESTIKVMIKAQEVFFGPGSEELFDCIEREGSVKAASNAMGLSYSKARKILSLFEKQYGHAAVIQQRGGAKGGEAELTSEAKLFLSCYKEYRMRCEEEAKRIFKECFNV